MPSAKRVAWAQLRVGIVAVVAMVLLATIIFLITGSTSFFEKEATLYTYMGDSAALTSGANVRINGILGGRVTAVALSGLADRRRTVRVTMAVAQRLLPQIPDDSVAAISAENMLGSKYINIRRGDSPNMVKPGGILPSKDTSEFDDVVASGYSVLNAAQGLLKRLDGLLAEVEHGRGSIGKLIYDTQLYDNLNGTAGEANKLVAQLNSGKGTVSRLFYDDTLMEDMHRTLSRVNALMDGLEQGQGTAGRLLKDDAVYEELRKTIAEYRRIAADLNAGKGSAGKLLKDEALHKNLEATLARLDTLVDKINQGQGTLGQLLVNPQMYESLNGASRELHEFLKAFRANPKKYLSIKLGLF